MSNIISCTQANNAMVCRPQFTKSEQVRRSRTEA